MEQRFRYFVLVVVALGVMVSLSLYYVVNRGHQTELANSFQTDLARLALLIEDRLNAVTAEEGDKQNAVLAAQAPQILLLSINDFRLRDSMICLVFPSGNLRFCNMERVGDNHTSNLIYQAPLSLQGDVAGELIGQPGTLYFSDQHGWEPVLILAVSLFLTFLVAIYLGFTYHRASEVRALIAQRTQQLNEANKQLELLSLTDSLTGVVNRRGFDESLRNEWGRAIRSKQSLTLLMVDVDNFKLFNDHYGHLAGDECLKQVAGAINAVPGRLGDMVARYGGEEFTVLLPNTQDLIGAVAERCRVAVNTLLIPHAHSEAAEHVTISIGSASLKPHLHDNPEDLVRMADDALYNAKSMGRNRVECVNGVVAGANSSENNESSENDEGNESNEDEGGTELGEQVAVTLEGDTQGASSGETVP